MPIDCFKLHFLLIGITYLLYPLKFQSRNESSFQRRRLPRRPDSMSLRRNNPISPERHHESTTRVSQSLDNSYEPAPDDIVSRMEELFSEPRIVGFLHSISEESTNEDLYACIPEPPDRATLSNSAEILFTAKSYQPLPNESESQEMETWPLGFMSDNAYAKVSGRSDITNTVSLIDADEEFSNENVQQSLSGGYAETDFLRQEESRILELFLWDLLLGNRTQVSPIYI